MANKIRQEDEVVVIAGRSKGTRGTVQKILKDGRYIVSGVNIVKKHQKPNPQLQLAGGIIEKEAPIQISNIAIWNDEAGKADRVGFKILEDGTKVRIFKSTSAEIDAVVEV